MNIKMKRIEVLAPVGGTDALTAAVRSGADAVYLGGKELNARRSAGNFCVDELLAAVRLCHSRGVKVYLTLNTLASDSEIEKEARQALKNACEIGIDAVIVQDLGIISLVRECAPQLPIHASTQTSVHSLAGVKMLAEMGCSRAVLAREMSFEEIKAVAEKSPIELEVFVHGAQCMCVSGQCLLSAMLGSRSANRGLCAQPCRLPFAAEGGTGNDLSLKDLSIISHLRELQAIGVASAKIEGRMKRPEYVAAAVTACRRALDGQEDAELGEMLRGVFSRSGFTDGYFTAKRGVSMFGIRRREDVSAAAPTLKTLAHLYEKERQTIPFSAAFTALEGERATLAVSARGKSFFAETDSLVEAAHNRPLTAESVSAQLEKCGGTPFFAEKIESEIGDNVSLPLSAINALRRSALEGLLERLSQSSSKAYLEKSVEKSVHKVEKPCVYARFANVEQIPDDCSALRKIILPLGSKIPDRLLSKAVVEIPRVFFGNENRALDSLCEAEKSGVEFAFAATVDGMALAKRAGMKIIAGFGSNIFNTRAIDEAEHLGISEVLLSCEMTLAQIRDLGAILPRGIVAYGRLPLMITRNCPVANGKSCAECKKSGVLTDRMGISFPVACSAGYSELLNSRPLYMADRLAGFRSADFLMLYFTIENSADCARQINNLLGFAPPPENSEYTRGLYFRGVE